MNKKALKELILNYTANKPMTTVNDEGVSVQFSLDEMKNAYLEQLSELGSTPQDLRRNAISVYELVEEMVADILPKRVQTRFAAWAEVESTPWGQKKVYKVKKGRMRGKSFITQVGPSGKFEAFRLDSDKFEIKTHMEGGAGYIDMFDFVRGDVTLADISEVLLEGLEESVYKQVFLALTTVGTKMPAANVKTHAGFDPTKMRDLLTTVKAYGTGAVIYCFPSFAASLIHDAGFSAYISDADKTDMREKGHLGKWFGAEVVVLDNSFTDETNAELVFDESKAIIMPLGGDSRPVKILFEGTPIAKEYENRGNFSTEFMIMQAFGVAITHQNFYGIYENTSL